MNNSIKDLDEAKSIATSENRADKPIKGGPPVTLSPKALPTKVIDAGGSGNCFFFSMYEALCDNNLLTDVCDKLKISNKREQFNLNFRKLLSESQLLEDDYLSTVKRLCELKFGVLQPGDTRSSFDEMLKGLPLQQKTLLKSLQKKSCGDTDIIVNALKNAIKINKVWVGEIEVNCVKQILWDECKVVLDIKKRTISPLLPKKNRIVLYNEEENHYKWFQLIKPTGGGKTRRNRSKRRYTRRA
jgi:hypothetical protein